MTTNLMGTCLFASICLAVKASTWAEMLSAVVGKKWTTDDLLKASERVINMERLINHRYGFDRKDDTLPKRLLKKPAPDGVGKGQVVDLDKALDSYYAAISMGRAFKTVVSATGISYDQKKLSSIAAGIKDNTRRFNLNELLSQI